MQWVLGVRGDPILVLHEVLVGRAYLTHRDVDDGLGQHHKVVVLVEPKLHLWAFYRGCLEEEILEPLPSNTDIRVHGHQGSILTLKLYRETNRRKKQEEYFGSRSGLNASLIGLCACAVKQN